MENTEKTAECPVCGGNEKATGKLELRGEQTYFELTCEDCGSTGFHWKAEWEGEKGEG